MKQGKVVLVGAGPGDPGLLTIKGKKLLESADTVVYDRLVGPGILSMIPPSAKTIDVGKQSGCHPVPQETINLILLEEAQAGRLVVRLKGGDPFLFGRGGEVELLAQNEIPFEIIPGVTSSLAAPAYAGIPVTHRDYASSLHIITAHGKEPGQQPDYALLAQTKGTLVFLMGVSSLPQICEGLLQAGMSSETPAAVVENGTSSRQRQILSTLRELPADAATANIHSPATIIVGNVCSLAASFHWADRRPLDGMRVIVTRPQARASSLMQIVSLLGAEAVAYPCIHTVDRPLTPSLRDSILRSIDCQWIVFTSATGVEAFFRALKQLRVDVRRLSGCHIAALGRATANALEERGILVDVIPQEYSSAALGQELLSHLQPGDRVFLPRASAGSKEFTLELERSHINFEELPLYDTEYVTDHPLSAASLVDGSPCFVVFTSASTVRGFAASIGTEVGLSSFHAVCIGRQTALQVQELGMPYTISRIATVDGLVECLCHLADVRKR